MAAGAGPIVNQVNPGGGFGKEHDNLSPNSSKSGSSCRSDHKISSLLCKMPALGEIFDLKQKIGEGTFSSVYLGSLKVKNEKEKRTEFAIKHLIPTCHPSRIVRELKCMQDMGGVDNVVPVLLCLRVNDCVTFVMPYQPHDKFSAYIHDMSIAETQLYLKELLKAVRRVHSFGVIHRDIKPSNFLYNRRDKKFLLVDFGLAQKVGECTTSENAEKTENKKRKRNDEGENQEPGSDLPSLKRQALQSLSSNVNIPSREDNSSKKISSEVKRVPLQNFNGSNTSQMSFIRVQNSQAKAVYKNGEKLFAKPQIPRQCECDGKAQVCHSCLTRKTQTAPRAGTPGFRPPEVLLKYPHQTTAVDIWAVGVIMLCLLSGTYPFFRSPDDVTALAEIITVFGSRELKRVAKKLGRNIVCSEDCDRLNLEVTCKRLKSRGESNYPKSAYDLLNRLLEVDQDQRITAEEALSHPFIANEIPN